MTPPCGARSRARRKEIGQDCYQRMRQRVALCVANDCEGGDASEAGEPPAAEAAPEALDAIDAIDSPEVELASQTIWTAIHGLVSLLIARPEFPWLERERLIDSVIEGALRALRPSAGRAGARPAAPAPPATPSS